MRQDPIETVEYKGCAIKVYNDDDVEDPRNWDNIGVMVCFHRRYTLGDKDQGIRHEDFSSWQELADYLKKERKAKIIFPLYLYDHSGLSMKIGSFQGYLPQGHAEFDSGQVGFIYATAEKIREEYGKGPKAYAKAKKYLYGEVETYDQYLRGDVYGYIAEGPNGEKIDSCWGFYGYDYMVKEAESNIDFHLAEEKKKHEAKVKTLIKNKVPLEKRRELLKEA